MRYLIAIGAIVLSNSVSSQRDSGSVTIPLVGIHFGGQLPQADLADRFGPNLAAGGAFLIKDRRNWVYGLQGSYFFGRNVKEDVLVNLRNEDGFVIDNEGFPADLRITERGILGHFVFGRVFSFLSDNPNSGLLIMAGVGAVQHRIKLFDAQQKIASVHGDLATGYDRLSVGWSTHQFIGYLYLSEYRMLNFYAGIELFQGFTKNVRKYNYDTGQPDTRRRFDGLAGLRFGWILPLYKKTPDEFYYY